MNTIRAGMEVSARFGGEGESKRNGPRFQGGIIYRQDGSRAHLRERLNDVAEASGLREGGALGTDDDDVETFEIALRLHGDAGAGTARGSLDGVAGTENALGGGDEGRPREGHPALSSSSGGHCMGRNVRRESGGGFGGSPTTVRGSRVRENGAAQVRFALSESAFRDNFCHENQAKPK